MDEMAVSPPSRRREVFIRYAVEKKFPAAYVEKDFWECWLLHRIFSPHSSLPGTFLLKGGFSLSKPLRAIFRFTDDIDLSISRESLGFYGEKNPFEARSKTKQGNLVQQILEDTRSAIEKRILPSLIRDFSSVLGVMGELWELKRCTYDKNSLIFRYPRALEPSDDCSTVIELTHEIRFDFSPGSERWHSSSYEISPYCCEFGSSEFQQLATSVRVLSPEHTFWDKVTYVHAEHHRPNWKRISERSSRHYYDLCRLWGTEIGRRAVVDIGLLSSVIHHKTLFFNSSWANYSSARPGRFRLLPPEWRYESLAEDYKSTSEMIFENPPSIDDILQTISTLEYSLNH